MVDATSIDGLESGLGFMLLYKDLAANDTLMFNDQEGGDEARGTEFRGT